MCIINFVSITTKISVVKKAISKIKSLSKLEIISF